MRRTALAGLSGGLALLSMTGCVPLYGGSTAQTKGADITSIRERVDPAKTPELDSLILFGSGLLGSSGLVYARTRWRRRKSSSAD